MLSSPSPLSPSYATTTTTPTTSPTATVPVGVHADGVVPSSSSEVGAAAVVAGNTYEVVTPAATTSLGNEDESGDDSAEDDDDDDAGDGTNRWLDVSSDRDDHAAADDAYFAADGEEDTDVGAFHFASDIPTVPVKTSAHELDAIETAKRDLLRYERQPYSTMYDDAEDPFETDEAGRPQQAHTYQPSPAPEAW